MGKNKVFWVITDINININAIANNNTVIFSNNNVTTNLNNNNSTNSNNFYGVTCTCSVAAAAA